MKALFVQLLFLCIILCSCVFSPDKENFVDVDPTSSPPEVTDQNLDLNADTLFVWKYTRFKFDLKSNDQPIKSVVVTYGDQHLTFGSNIGSFEINPQTYPEGISHVHIQVYTTSGTGSMADKIGAEGYVSESDWVLVVDKPKAPVIHITSSIENGFLKFSWNKMDKPYFHSYRLEIENKGLGQTYYQEITNKNTTSFVDSFFVGGKINLNLGVNYYDQNEMQIRTSKEYTYEFPVEITFKEDLENMTISWNKNPFQCTKYFDINGSNQIEIKTDTSYILPAPGLGPVKRYHVAFQPIKQFYTNYLTSNLYKLYTKGVNDSIEHMRVEYNAALGRYFFKDEMNIRSTDQHIDLVGAYRNSWDDYDNSTLTFSKDNKSVYSIVDQNLIELSSSGMDFISSKQNPVASENNINTWILKNLEPDVFLVGYNNDYGYFFTLFNAKTYTIIDSSVKMPGDFVTLWNYYFTISEDGKYAAYCGSKGLFVYEIVDNQKLVLKYKDSNVYYSCFFDPTYPEKLILNRPTGYQVFNCASVLVEKTNDRFIANPINIDPLTHYLLLVSNSKKKIYVYDAENDVVKLEMNHHGSAFDFKLLNNIIFENSGYHFDISSYVH